jgi:hypothetical protein
MPAGDAAGATSLRVEHALSKQMTAQQAATAVLENDTRTPWSKIKPALSRWAVIDYATSLLHSCGFVAFSAQKIRHS